MNSTVEMFETIISLAPRSYPAAEWDVIKVRDERLIQETVGFIRLDDKQQYYFDASFRALESMDLYKIADILTYLNMLPKETTP